MEALTLLINIMRLIKQLNRNVTFLRDVQLKHLQSHRQIKRLLLLFHQVLEHARELLVQA